MAPKPIVTKWCARLSSAQQKKAQQPMPTSSPLVGFPSIYLHSFDESNLIKILFCFMYAFHLRQIKLSSLRLKMKPNKRWIERGVTRCRALDGHFLAVRAQCWTNMRCFSSITMGWWTKWEAFWNPEEHVRCLKSVFPHRHIVSLLAIADFANFFFIFIQFSQKTTQTTINLRMAFHENSFKLCVCSILWKESGWIKFSNAWSNKCSFQPIIIAINEFIWCIFSMLVLNDCYFRHALNF